METGFMKGVVTGLRKYGGCTKQSLCVGACLPLQSCCCGVAGAIFGIGGALAMFLYRHKEVFGQGGNQMLEQLGRNLALNVVYGLIMPNVDNWYESLPNS